MSATLGVILLHSAALYFSQDYNTLSWHYANVIDSFTRSSVPLFLMLSGALLLNPKKSESPIDFLKHRLRKIVFPLLFWSLFYYCFTVIMAGNSFVLSAFLTGLLSGNIYYHLPFIYYLIGLYLTYPIIRSFLRGSVSGDSSYFLCLWLIIIAIGWVSSYFSIPVSRNLLIMLNFIGYPLAGWLIASSKKENKKHVFAGILYIFIGCITAALTWRQKSIGGYDQFFYEYLSLNIVIASFALFYFLRFISWDLLLGRYCRSAVLFFSILSFDIYFIHPFFLAVLSIYIIPPIFLQKSFFGIPILFISTTVASIFTAFLIGFVKKYINSSNYLRDIFIK